MKLKILFHGFRHAHVNGLYKKVLASEDFEIVGCIETNSEARAAAEKTLGARFSEKSYEEWLRESVDVVAVGDAYGDRGETVLKAFAAGKHVIADKPICTDLAQLEKMRLLAIEKGVKIACMLDLRYLPQVRKAKELLDDGSLGAVRNVSFNGQHYIDYPRRPTWYFEVGMHGGTINDLAIHGIDLVRVLTGLEFCHVDAARVWNAYATNHPQFRDSALFMARLSNGAGVLADTSYSTPALGMTLPTYWEFRFWCEKGMLTFNYKDASVTVYRDGAACEEILPATEPNGSYLAELVNEIREGTSSVTEGVLRSTETALWIQQEAEKEFLL